MLTLTVLGSGSSGNCSLVASGQCRILVDAGFSAFQICQRLGAVGVGPETLDGILITHEHGDHVAGVATLSRRFGIPVYVNALTAEAAGLSNCNVFQTGGTFTVKGIEIQSFYVPHDAVDPTAFVLTSDEGSVGIVTDLGYVPKLVLERVRHVHTLLIEANHDENMLKDGPRPWALKQRILSRHGHLSNENAAKLVAAMAGNNLERVILGHLSRDCNTPEVALGCMHRYGLEGLTLFCADQYEPSPGFPVE